MTRSDVVHYERRSTQALGLGEVSTVKVKWYLITAGSRTLVSGLWQQIEKQLEAEIDTAGDPMEHGVGFGIVHLARDGDYVLFSRWYDRNMLKHRVYRAQVDEAGTTQLHSMRDTDIAACVWEMALMAHERDAWVEAMSRGLDSAALEAYLQAVYGGMTV